MDFATPIAGAHDLFTTWKIDPAWQGEVPLTVILDPEGKVIYRESGSIDPLTVRRAIVKAMNERKPW